MTDQEFKWWIEASHHYVKVFWGGSEYSISLRWVDEWFGAGKFCVSSRDSTQLSDRVSDSRFAGLQPILKNYRSKKWNSNPGLAIAPYLFTWNINRFTEYSKRCPSFSIETYFNSLGALVRAEEDILRQLRAKSLAADGVDEYTMRVFKKTNAALKEIGIGQNEPVGTVKILHILAPNYFPLVDNPIAETMELKGQGESLAPEDYLDWMNRLSGFLKAHSRAASSMQRKFNRPILKLIDEGLYVMCTKYRELPENTKYLEI